MQQFASFFCVVTTRNWGKGFGFKPGAYKAFVVREKIQKCLQAKQRQQEQMLLLLMTLLSFVGSLVCFLIFKNQGANLPHYFL
jgi:hypothetical protein